MKENPDIYEDPRVGTKSNLRYADAEGNRYAEPGAGRTDTRAAGNSAPRYRKPGDGMFGGMRESEKMFVVDSKNPNVMRLKR
jgi:hypothetical protein